MRMKSPNLGRYVRCCCVAAAMLAGCGGSQPPIGAPSAIPQAFSHAAHADRRTSWMLAEAKSESLLYISGGVSGDVYVFSYPSGKPVGEITKLNVPEGECVDRSGDVFVVAEGNARILEYPHGATRALNKLDDRHGIPLGCAIDSTTGNLAVTNSADYYSPSNIAVYASGRGKPTIYPDKDISSFYFCGYDDRGDLFVGGFDNSLNPVIVKLSRGTSEFESISLNHSIGTTGGVQWDGRYLAIGDQSGSIYRFRIKGARASEVGTTVLGGAGSVVQFWIQARNVIGGDLDSGKVMFWRYPAGGGATKVLGSSFSDPVAATVSVAK